MHLHLSDYQGWRIEIKRHPRLTEIGSQRIDEYGNEYSGYYTQDDIRKIVNYAQEQFITIIPEIDVPGHSLAAIAAYPELGDNLTRVKGTKRRAPGLLEGKQRHDL